MILSEYVVTTYPYADDDTTLIILAHDPLDAASRFAQTLQDRGCFPPAFHWAQVRIRHPEAGDGVLVNLYADSIYHPRWN